MLFVIVVVILTILTIAMAYRLYRSLKSMKIKKQYTAALEAPSVSICIPARNETHAMTQCLERVLASDYKKMEIIVFDDRSVDNTSILIKSFAHAGVRFVPGFKLPEGWLGKNHALEVLAQEASGTYIIFMDVDTYIAPRTISQLVGAAITEKRKMVSVIPRRHDTWRASVLFGALRYFWELIFDGSLHKAVSSSIWLIDRRELIDTIGGFAAFKATVQPEEALALRFKNDYLCLVGDAALGVTYEKRWSSQVETSKRLLYPLLGSNWRHAFVGLVALVLLNVPFFAVLSSVFFGWTFYQLAALWFLILFMAIYAVYTSHLWQNRWWLGAFLWPIIILQEMILLIVSIYGYARGTITWKGRRVSL